MPDARPESPKAGNGPLVFTLVAMFAIGGFIALNVLSLGAFTWVVAIAGVIAVIGAFHYLMWGADLSQEVSDEREAFLRQQAREREKEEGWRG